MHELSLADTMIREIEQILDREKAEKVYSVTVLMGRLSGVEKEPFEFAFPIVSEGTRVEGSKLIIEIVSAAVKCDECQAETELDVPYAKCGSCNSRKVKFIRGREFIIKSLEIE